MTGQNQVKLVPPIKQDEGNPKISNILLPWQHSRFEPSLIRNTIISFSIPSRATMEFLLLLVCIGTPGSTFNCNRLKLFTS